MLVERSGRLAPRRWGWRPERNPFESFWEPVFRCNESVLLVVANPVVYHPAGRAQRLGEGLEPPAESPESDIVPAVNQDVGVGDMMAATEAVEMLGRHQKASGVRPDLRGKSTVLIGAVTNRWTREMQKSWRFQFRRQAGVRNVILDTVESREWAPPMQEDLILLYRIPTSPAGGVMMATAGGRLLAD